MTYPPAPAGGSPPRGRWRTFTTADGLAALHVEHIVEDHEGRVWCATNSGGVSRFDGDTFRTFTVTDGLVSDLLQALLCDRHGRIWCGTLTDGLCWYEGEAFHRFEPGAWCSSGGAMFLFEDSQGRIWTAGGSGIGYWDGRALHDLSTAYERCCGRRPGLCWGIAEDAAGGIWVAGEELVRWDGTAFSRAGTGRGLDGPAQYYTAARDGEGILWVGRRDQLWRWDGARFQPANAPFQGGIRKLQTDRAGRLWVCIAAGALVHDGDAFHALTTEDGLAHPWVNSMCQDHEGQFWFATWGGGVSRLDPYGCHLPGGNTKACLGEAWSLVTNGDRVRWAGVQPSRAGERRAYLGAYDRAGLAEEDLALSTGAWWPPVLAADRTGGLWLGISSGLYHCSEGSSWTQVYPQESGVLAPVWGLAIDAADRPCFTGGPWARWQLLRYDGQGFQVLSDDLPAVGSPRALLLARDGHLWVGLGALGVQGQGGGLVRVAGDGRVRRWTRADGLIDERVTDLAQDRDGGIWIATLGGLSFCDGARFVSFTRADGLPSHHVLCLHLDSQGRLWLGMQGALAVYDGHTFQYQWLPDLGSIHDLVSDVEGALWLATDKGVRRYLPQAHPPGVRLVRLVADRVYEGAAEVHMSASAPEVCLEYGSQSLRTAPGEMVYRCRLQGYDQDWQRPTRARQVRYPQLPVGKYRFEVQTVDRDLNYSEPASVRLVVEPDPHLEGLTQALSAGSSRGEFVGDSAAMRRVLVELHQVGATETTVMILGETGTGKGLAAHTVHTLSERRTGPFITVSCGALPEGLVESELFGHERGAFTGAHRRQLGKVELARGGTLFLDEVGDLPPAAQAKVLRLLEEGTFERVGGSEALRCQARLVAATNRDLAAMVAAGAFREDLYYRLEVFVVHLPPLRERQEDIELLALYFLHRTAAHLHKPQLTGIAPAALQALQQHPWPGNVRELEHVVQRAVIVGAGPILEVDDLALAPALPAGPTTYTPPLSPGFESLAEHERRYIEQVLAHTGQVIKGPRGAAEFLGIPRSTLYSRMRKLGIARPSPSDSPASARS